MKQPFIARDVSTLPDNPLSSEAPLWWGIMGLIAIEATVFASLFTSYFYLRLGFDYWPPPGVPLIDLALPTVNLLLVLSTSWPMIKATRVAVQTRKPPTLYLGYSVVTFVVVDVIRFYEFTKLPFRWDENAYTSIFWAILGLHFTHIIAAFLGTGAIAAIAWRGPLKDIEILAIQVDGMYWQFVAWVALPLYLVLYIVPRFI